MELLFGVIITIMIGFIIYLLLFLNGTIHNTSTNERKPANRFHHEVKDKISAAMLKLMKLLNIKSDGSAIFSISISEDTIKNEDFESLESIINQFSSVGPVTIIQYTPSNNNNINNNENIPTNVKLSKLSISTHRFLYCTTMVGKIAIIRQLKPVLHIEYEPYIASQVAPFVRTVLFHSFEQQVIKDLPNKPWKVVNNLSQILNFT